jgi:MFS family permease
MNKVIGLIVFAEMLATSLWFSTNSVISQIENVWGLTDSGLGLITNSVQLGFIFGTLFFTVTGLADKFRPSRIVSLCCLIGALANLLIIVPGIAFSSALFLRFIVGISLAGIYPIGMKLIITWDPKRASNSLSLLVGMLVVGSALPYFIRAAGINFAWQYTVSVTSIMCTCAAVIIFCLGDGSHLQNRENGRISFISDFKELLLNKKYISSALGYFGHMWELYAFWTCVPLLLTLSLVKMDEPNTGSMLSILSFLIIGIGSIGCIVGGVMSRKYGSQDIATASLFFSGFMCLVYPVLGNINFQFDLLLLLTWGFFVISDSPHFSAISAKVCPTNLVGTALTLQNSIGFSISMITIFVTTQLFEYLGNYICWILLPGPLFGLLFFSKEFGFNSLSTES